MKQITVPDYNLIAKCGRGAYGDVYVAKSLSGALVALKVIEKNIYSKKEFNGLKYYCSRCGNSPYLTKIFHSGEEDSFFYYTMELADNLGDENNYIPATLANYLVDKKRLSPHIVRELALNLLSGLETLHHAGLVHRDIKPENIIYVNQIPKLSDIGLVSSVSATFSLGGTLGFIPPEKLKSSTGSKSATDDLYALGKLIYCAFSGNTPDKFPSLPPDLILDEEVKRLNDVILIACNQISPLRFHSITQFRNALTTSVSRKRKILNFTWKYRYYCLISIILYLFFTITLKLIINKPYWAGDYNEIVSSNAPLPNTSGVIRSSEIQEAFPQSLLPINAPIDDNLISGKSEVFQKMGVSSVLPPVISDAEFKKLMNQAVDDTSLVDYTSKVEYYLMEKGCVRFPAFQKEFASYLLNLAALEALMFKYLPNKVAEIKTLVKNSSNPISVPYTLVPLFAPDIWNDKRIFDLYCNCAISSENLNVSFTEIRGQLPEAIAWDKYVVAAQLYNRKKQQPVSFRNPFGGKDSDFENVLASYQSLLQNSSPEKREYNRQRALKFLEELKSNVSSPAIVALKDTLQPLDIQLDAAKAIYSFAQKNIDGYVLYKYHLPEWLYGKYCSRQNDQEVIRRIQNDLNNLPAIQRQRTWLNNKKSKINALREKELENVFNPQAVLYQKAQSILMPYLKRFSADAPDQKSD